MKVMNNGRLIQGGVVDSAVIDWRIVRVGLTISLNMLGNVSWPNFVKEAHVSISGEYSFSGHDVFATQHVKHVLALSEF